MCNGFTPSVTRARFFINYNHEQILFLFSKSNNNTLRYGKIKKFNYEFMNVIHPNKSIRYISRETRIVKIGISYLQTVLGLDN